MGEDEVADNVQAGKQEHTDLQRGKKGGHKSQMTKTDEVILFACSNKKMQCMQIKAYSAFL